ncbi:hypothetical protein GLYMA_05G053050v4 [Glycine max]|nr:hypothetical protein GLYMA_05G053050v4 [Glycine max]KAH1132917.1 hypothetical protein GYH30_011653 [Glycine max]
MSYINVLRGLLLHCLGSFSLKWGMNTNQTLNIL